MGAEYRVAESSVFRCRCLTARSNFKVLFSPSVAQSIWRDHVHHHVRVIIAFAATSKEKTTRRRGSQRWSDGHMGWMYACNHRRDGHSSRRRGKSARRMWAVCLSEGLGTIFIHARRPPWGYRTKGARRVMVKQETNIDFLGQNLWFDGVETSLVCGSSGEKLTRSIMYARYTSQSN